MFSRLGKTSAYSIGGFYLRHSLKISAHLCSNFKCSITETGYINIILFYKFQLPFFLLILETEPEKEIFSTRSKYSTKPRVNSKQPNNTSRKRATEPVYIIVTQYNPSKVLRGGFYPNPHVAIEHRTLVHSKHWTAFFY